MPKLRSSTRSRVTVRGRDKDYVPAHHPVTNEQARHRAVLECLRDLAGIELIYAIRCPDGIVKIGRTRDLMARRRHFDSAPEAILAITPGTYEEEQALHDRLQASVARGREYYHPTPEVLAFVNSLRSALGVEPV